LYQTLLARLQERLAELDLLRKYLEEAVEAVDKAVASNISAVERMKKLLTSPDKKQCISEMAAANEIDVALIDLLQQVSRLACVTFSPVWGMWVY
jgi:hypothetical protein